MSRRELTHELVEAQREIVRLVQQETFAELLDVDLTMAQLKALAAIEGRPDCTIGMLSEQLGVKAPASSLIVDKLVLAGLAYRIRDSIDGRRVIVRPTAKGAELVRRIRHGRRSLIEGWVSQLSEADLASLGKGMAALVAIAREFPLDAAAKRHARLA
jgi:DNA-binding MarR family transcriptional regulator